MSWLRRIAHAKGYGIHSPFAYRFVRECVGERLPYYAYARYKTKPERLLYRLAVFFQPAHIQAHPAFPPAQAAQAACPASQLPPGVPRGEGRRPDAAPTSQSFSVPGHFMAGSKARPKAGRRPPEWMGVESIVMAIAAPGEPVPDLPAGKALVACVFAPSPESLRTLRARLDALGHGMLFHHPGKLAIAVALPSLPRQEIDIALL